MKILLAGTLATLVFVGNAAAAGAPASDSFRIESEAQFNRDYGDRVERVGPGVYQVVGGELAGKVIAIGEAGLAYDLDAQRAIAADSASPRHARLAARQQIRKLEGVQARYAKFRTQNARDPRNAAAKNAFSTLACSYRPVGGSSRIYYSGYGVVTATTSLYLDRGDGQLNPYYARASASASGGVTIPAGVPLSTSLWVDAYAQNLQTGQTVTRTLSGIFSAGVSTGYVYSGAAFFHDLRAFASVTGSGNCVGYLSVSDRIDLGF